MRGVDRVVVRDGDAIGALLTRIGAHESVLAWEERRMRREVRATANRLANFDDANLRRSARAAVAAGARVERALEILGDDAPEHLLQAGRLRLEHKQASLEELGALADPPMTKDAVAGRIRRLLAMADKRAAELGIPDTESAVTPDMLGALTASDAGPRDRGQRSRVTESATGGAPASQAVHASHRGASSVTVRVGINGFGRIGRNFFRAVAASGADIEIVAVNDLADVATLAHLLKYDSVLGRFGRPVVGRPTTASGSAADASRSSPSATRPPCRGATSASTSSSSRPASSPRPPTPRKHLDGGAKKVIISAPGHATRTSPIVMGVNDDQYDPAKHHIISQRLLHHELPGAAGQGARRRVRHRAAA